MRVVCPGCAAVYEPPTHLLAPGRRLRCARCDQSWALAGIQPGEAAMANMLADPGAESPAGEPVDAAAGLPPIDVDRAAVAEPPANANPATIAAVRLLPSGDRASAGPGERLLISPAPAPRAAPGVVFGWVATCLVLCGVVWGAYTYRGQVMAAWPPSTRVYAGLGLVH